jgi:hypothetical protein
MRIHLENWLAAVCLPLLGSSPLPAQAASSATYFLPSSEVSPGGEGTSFTYRLTAGSGSGVTPSRSLSISYVLEGGFPASLDATVTGRPWVTGVRALYGPLLGGTQHVVHGTELDLGALTTVDAGGAPAAVRARARDQLLVTLPGLSSPGWKSVAVTNTGGTSTLPGGVGVLPMMDRPRAVLAGAPFRLTYRGASGDAVVWCVALGNGPVPIPIPPFLHALELDLLTLLVVPAGTVTDPSGELHLDIPAVFFTRPVHVQAFCLSGNLGWTPGAFTNVLQL